MFDHLYAMSKICSNLNLLNLKKKKEKKEKKELIKIIDTNVV